MEDICFDKLMLHCRVSAAGVAERGSAARHLGGRGRGFGAAVLARIINSGNGAVAGGRGLCAALLCACVALVLACIVSVAGSGGAGVLAGAGEEGREVF